MELLLAFVVLFVISTIILIVSMIITSNLMGGVEFGAVHHVILKGAGLLVLINLLALIPYVGIWLTLPVWWGGLMVLFHIDFWEARTLVFVNWGLNLLVKLFLLGLLVRPAGDKPTPPPDFEDEEKHSSLFLGPIRGERQSMTHDTAECPSKRIAHGIIPWAPR
jgi:hypothetical protein